MDLQELLGADYKEGMTAEEVNSFFENKILSSGKYENKEKVEAERRANQKKLSELQQKVNGQLSDDEKKNQELEDLKAQLAAVTEREALSKKETSKLLAKSNLAEAKTLLEIQDNDKEFAKFMEAISVEDKDIASATSGYVMKLIKSAYEKGKSESTKNSLGEMGKMAIGADGKEVDATTAFVKALTAQTIGQGVKNSKSNFS